MNWSQLPVVALVKVLGYLPLSDQLNARRVCKYWHVVNDHSVPRRELILFYELHPRPVCWHHSNQKADLNNALMVNDHFLESEFFSAYFRKIQRLMVAFPVNTPCKQLIELIQASFADLQHLQFTSIGDWVYFYLQRGLQSELRLENLRTFYAQAADVPLNLNCPKLSELFTLYDLTIDERTNEQTKKCLQNLKLLKVYRLAYPPGFEFSQLQVLHYMHDPEIFHLTISLVDFPMLKELHCHFADNNLVNELLQQKERLKRENLRIYLRGFLLERVVALETVAIHLDAASLKLAKESPSSCNFSLERKSLFLCNSSDDELASLKEDELPESLLMWITDIIIGWPEEKLSKVSPAFFEICDRFPCVYSITIHDEVSQDLLNRLPDVFPYLECFTYEPTIGGNLLICFKSLNFVGRFKTLSFFTTCNHLISIDEFKLIHRNCKVLKDVILFQSRSIFDTEHVRLGIELVGKAEERIYELNWARMVPGNWRDFARTSFDYEELLSYLEVSKWAQKMYYLAI